MSANNTPLALYSLKAQRNIFFVIIIIFLLCNLLLTIALFKTDKTIVLVPSLSPEKTIIYNANSLSDEYYFALAGDIITIFLNISPETVEFNYNRLSKLILPEMRGEFLSELRKIKHNVERKKLNTVFFLDPEKTKLDRKKNQVLISGKLKTLTSNTVTSEEEKHYLINFEFFKGQIFVRFIQEVKNV